MWLQNYFTKFIVLYFEWRWILRLAGAQKFTLVNDNQNFTVNAIENNELWVILKKKDSVLSEINKYFTILQKRFRKILLALRDNVKETLGEMVQNNLIISVSEPTDYQYPIVIYQKFVWTIFLCICT